MDDYERTDYAALAKEFGCHLRFGTYGVTFGRHVTPVGKRGWKLFKITPLTGWITDPKEVERVIRENGLEL